ncbi:unnamed protein product, partial [Prorocentrum cordatum]
GSPASRRTGSWWSRSPRSGVSGRTSRWPAWRCPTPPPARPGAPRSARRTASTCGRASSPGADVSPVAVAATAVVSSSSSSSSSSCPAPAWNSDRPRAPRGATRRQRAMCSKSEWPNGLASPNSVSWEPRRLFCPPSSRLLSLFAPSRPPRLIRLRRASPRAARMP